jgi:hypothetical protein
MKPNANITIATTIVRTTSFASLIQFPPFRGVNYPMATERKGFYPQCLRKTSEQSEREALRIKACWTEPLVTRAKLASSMGIVKWNGAATKVAQLQQASRLNVSAGIAAVGRRVSGSRAG